MATSLQLFCAREGRNREKAKKEFIFRVAEKYRRIVVARGKMKT